MPPRWLRHLSYKSFQNTWPAKRAVESFLISKFQFLTQIILLQKPSKVKTDLRKRDENENRFRKRQDFHLCVFTANLAKTKTKTAMFINLAVLTFVFRETRKNTLVKILRFTKTVFVQVSLSYGQTYENETRTNNFSENRKTCTIEHTTDNFRGF